MVGSERKFSCALSWADEVEKEEEEDKEARFQLLQNQKPNPFGSARPREVVLQERGIDCKNLHQDLLPKSSHIRRKELKEKTLKENVPAPTTVVAIEKKQPIPTSKRALEQKLQNAKSSYVQMPHQQFFGVFVPPLRHPPKNMIANLFGEAQRSQIPYNYGTNFDQINERENENSVSVNFRNSKIKSVHNLHNADSDYRRGKNYERNLENSTSRHQPKNTVANLIGEAVGSRIPYNYGGNFDQRSQNFGFMNSRNSRIASAHDLRNVDSDYRRMENYGGSLGNSTSKNKRNAILIDENRDCKPRKDLHNPNMEKTGFQGNYKRRMLSSSSEVIGRNKHGDERQSARKFASSSDAGDHMKKSRPNGNQKRR